MTKGAVSLVHQKKILTRIYPVLKTVKIQISIESIVHPDQLASEIYTVFCTACKYMLITGILQINWMKLERCVAQGPVQLNNMPSPIIY